MTAAVTTLEALRRLYEVARKVDASESGEFDNALQGELAVAESVLRAVASVEAVGFVSENAVRQLSRGFTATIFPTCNDSDGERIGLYAAPVVPVAAQPVVPEGWVVTHNPPWPSFTDAANARYRYSVSRVIAPMCTDTGFSNWTGATIEEALRAGCDALGLAYAAPSLEAQPAGEVVRMQPNSATSHEVIEHMWKMYQQGQCSADHTAKEVFSQTLQSFANWLVTQPTASMTDVAKDAARYRWLSKNSAYVAVNPHHRTCLWVLRNIFEVPGDGFDAAIDKAMAQGDKHE